MEVWKDGVHLGRTLRVTRVLWYTPKTAVRLLATRVVAGLTPPDLPPTPTGCRVDPGSTQWWFLVETPGYDSGHSRSPERYRESWTGRVTSRVQTTEYPRLTPAPTFPRRFGSVLCEKYKPKVPGYLLRSEFVFTTPPPVVP